VPKPPEVILLFVLLYCIANFEHLIPDSSDFKTYRIGI